jgi:hypothetical protein
MLKGIIKVDPEKTTNLKILMLECLKDMKESLVKMEKKFQESENPESASVMCDGELRILHACIHNSIARLGSYYGFIRSDLVSQIRQGSPEDWILIRNKDGKRVPVTDQNGQPVPVEYQNGKQVSVQNIDGQLVLVNSNKKKAQLQSTDGQLVPVQNTDGQLVIVEDPVGPVEVANRLMPVPQFKEAKCALIGLKESLDKFFPRKYGKTVMEMYNQDFQGFLAFLALEKYEKKVLTYLADNLDKASPPPVSDEQVQPILKAREDFREEQTKYVRENWMELQELPESILKDRKDLQELVNSVQQSAKDFRDQMRKVLEDPKMPMQSALEAGDKLAKQVKALQKAKKEVLTMPKEELVKKMEFMPWNIASMSSGKLGKKQDIQYKAIKHVIDAWEKFQHDPTVETWKILQEVANPVLAKWNPKQVQSVPEALEAVELKWEALSRELKIPDTVQTTAADRLQQIPEYLGKNQKSKL